MFDYSSTACELKEILFLKKMVRQKDKQDFGPKNAHSLAEDLNINISRLQTFCKQCAVQLWSATTDCCGEQPLSVTLPSAVICNQEIVCSM